MTIKTRPPSKEYDENFDRIFRRDNYLETPEELEEDVREDNDSRQVPPS